MWKQVLLAAVLPVVDELSVECSRLVLEMVDLRPVRVDDGHEV